MAQSISRPKVTGSIDINILLAFGFGVVFLIVMLVFAVCFPNPTPLQVRVFITALALSAAGSGAVIPGSFNVQYKPLFRAGGAPGLFAAVYWFQPTLEQAAVKLVPPAAPPEPVAAAYLAAIDAGDARGAWEQMDPPARETAFPDPEQMRQIYATRRAPLGAVTTRELVGVNGHESPPGWPVGLYRTSSYRTRFASAPACRAETVSLRATRDATWRVNSHLLSPAAVEC